MNSLLNDFGKLKDNHSDEQFRLLLRKGVYLFEYMSSWDKFDETRLPPKEAFHSDLNIVILVILVNMIMNMHKSLERIQVEKLRRIQ